MSIKNLFSNNKGVPKIQKTVSSDEMVETVESSEFVEAKRKQFDRFIPPIDFTTASNFAKYGSAELYYEKSFERIHDSYPYDGTLAEKVEFENSSSYLDKYVLDNLYPRTNGYINFDGSTHITVYGGPHTASAGMVGKSLDLTFDKSSVYEESKKRTSAFEFRREHGVSTEFWLKVHNTASHYNIFHLTSSDGNGIKLNWNNNQFSYTMHSASAQFVSRTITGLTANNDEWNHYALTFETGSSNFVLKFFKNGQLAFSKNESGHIRDILPLDDGLRLRIGRQWDNSHPLSGSIDEFRYWKSARTTKQVFNNWFSNLGGGSNKHDANTDLGLYFKFNEGITQIQELDRVALDYSGRFNNGVITGYGSYTRNTGSAITEKLSEPEFLDPIIYSSHPSVISKKAEYKLSGSLADKSNSTMFLNYFPFWMQEDDKNNGNQLKYLCQIIGSYFDTLWHQISYMNKIHDHYYVNNSKEPLPFSKKLLFNRGFVIQDLFTDSTLIENLKDKDENEVYQKNLNSVRNTIYHNIYNNLDGIYKSKGTEKSFRNFFRTIGIGQEIVKLKMYADDSTFVLRNNYEFKSHEKKYLNFNVSSHFSASIYQTSSINNSNVHIPGDKNYSGSFSLQSDIILPRKQKANEPNYNPYPYLTASLFGYHSTGSGGYAHPTNDYGLQVFAIHSASEGTLSVNASQRVKFLLTSSNPASNINLETDWYNDQYENNKWSIAVKLKHSTYPRAKSSGSIPDDYLLEFYGVEANGNSKKNYFYKTTGSIGQNYYSSDKIFYAGAHKTNFTGSTLHYSDVKLGYVRYWHSYLSNDAIDQHAFDTETYGTNEPFEQDLIDTYPVEIPREKTLAFHWSFDNLTGSDSTGKFIVSDLSSGSTDSNYDSLSNTIQRTIEAEGRDFLQSSSDCLDVNFLYSAKKRQPDDLLSSDLTTVKTNETEQFFVDDDVSDNFYSFEKSMWGVISEEMLNIFSTALDLNNLIGQPNQRYHHSYNMLNFLRDRFFEDVENEPNLEKFTSFYKWIDDSISLAIRQLIPASSRFSEKINNVIESHVLERNKYVHQVPITTRFESTEGSIKGISELKYNWKFGHAPTNPDNEANHVLWQRERKEKLTGSSAPTNGELREKLRVSRNNHSIQTAGLIRKELDGTAYLSDTYAIRKFAKTYDISAVSQHTIHGGTNFGRKKNLQLFHESIAPAGRKSGVPQNIITVGVGLGSGIVEEPLNNDLNPVKKKKNINALIGNRSNEEYGYKVSGDSILPMNIMSGTVNSGFNFFIETSYSSGVYLTNLHNDVVGNYNEKSLQGPFTEQHVGGLQYRHIDLNTGTDTETTRPEGWRILLKDHNALGPDADGAIGFVGPDYEAPYPSPNLQKANRYRDEHAKRPINIRNIKTTSTSQKVGNYKNEIELFSISPTFQKTWAVEAYDDTSVQILPTSISSALPLTTHYQSLMGIATFSSGNIFGSHSNNRQPDGALHTSAILGVKSSGSFTVTGSTVNGTVATGSFNVTGSPYAGALASGSFQITSSMIQGTPARGSFTMSGAFAPAVSASYDFRVIGRTVLGSTASGSFNVSGAFVPLTAATASFRVSSPPIGGNRSYAIFDANYQLATESDKFLLGRNNDTTGVEIDVLGNGVSINHTEVSPVNYQKAAETSGSAGFFGTLAAMSSGDRENFCINLYIKAADGSLNTDDACPIYQSIDDVGNPHVEIYFDSGSATSDKRRLVFRHYVSTTNNYGKWYWNNFGDSGLAIDGGAWTMLTFYRFGSNEIMLAKNAVKVSGETFDNSHLGGLSQWDAVSPRTQRIMSASFANQKNGWNGTAYPQISDWMMWGSSSQFSNTAVTDAGRLEFASAIYNTGILEPNVPSGSLLKNRFTFGDSPSDPASVIRNGDIIYDISTSGSNLTASFPANSNYKNSKFANKKTATEYFNSIKTAIQSHNSNSSYFDVSYETYEEVVEAGPGLAGTWFRSDTTAVEPGATFMINAGETLNYARFFISSSLETNAADYQISASVVTSSAAEQKKSFKNLLFNNTGSLQVSSTVTNFEDSTLTIDTAGSPSTVFRFDNHNNSQSGNKIVTFSATGSALSGSQNSDATYLFNSSYPSTSTLNGGSDFSVSFWHARAAVDSAIDTILSLDAPTGPTNNEGAVFIYSTSAAVFMKVYQNSSTSRFFYGNYTSNSINKNDLNHYIFTFDASTRVGNLYVNGDVIGSLQELGSAIASFSHTFNAIYVAGNPSSTAEVLEGRLDQVSVWDKVLTAAEASEIYNDGRRKDLHAVTCAKSLVHWYKLGDEDGLPSLGGDLSSFGTYKDSTIRSNDLSNVKSAANLTVNNGVNFSMASGLPTDNISDTTLWNNLSSSIEANVSDYNVAYVDNSTFATFTITNETAGPAGNGDSLSEASTLVSNLESTTGGGTNQSGVTDGAFITIDSVKFEVDDDGTSDGGGTFYIQNTGSNDEFWNALSQSIKNNTDFDTIGISGAGLTRTFSVTSSVRTAADNNVIGSINGEFSIIDNTAGGVDDTGANDGDLIRLRPTSDAADNRAFTVDRDNDGSNTSTQKFIHSVQSSNADWWNALTASIKAEGFGVSYVADSPSAGTASFTVTSNVAAAAGNSGEATQFTGTTFTNTGGASFAGGLDASGSLAGHTLTVSGTVFTLIDTGSPSATQVLTTGSGVTSETMFEDLRSKIEAATPYTVITSSSGIPRLFELTASVTGSGKSPNLAESGDTFTTINIGTDGVNEVGTEAGDSITIGGQTFTIVSGAPVGTQISFTGSSVEIRNALSQSIKNNTIFDSVTVTDLGTGYHRFDLTASAAGTTHNGLFTTNSSGVRDTFINLAGAAGGINSHGIVDTDRLTIGSTTFHLTASTSESDTGTNKFIQTTGSSAEIWLSLKSKIENALPYSVTTSDSAGLATFVLTASTTGSAKNAVTSEVGSSFTRFGNIKGGTDEGGIKDGNQILIGSKKFVLTASAPSDTSDTFHIETTGNSAQIWNALEAKIEANTVYDVAKSSTVSSATFNLTASVTGAIHNVAVTTLPSPNRTFSNLVSISGGVNFVPAIFGPDNVIQIPRTDLTGSERNIVTRFSAPGGVEIQTIGYLDAYTSTYSVHNALPFRNTSVLGSGSGEEGTIRVTDHLGLRRGLRTLRALHMGQFGIDSQYGQITSEQYPSSGSFNKQHRNRSITNRYSSGELIITGSNHDNMHINTPIPRSEFQYSWIFNSISDPYDGTQHILGYAPRDGIVSSSAGYVEALVFPSASSIFPQ